MKHHLQTARAAILDRNKPSAIRALRAALAEANQARRSDVRSYVMSAMNYVRVM
ncbi:hypothetical protein FIU93_22845 [Labrenzia sp. THAF35]|uniref:hypothetical protein n=1 Tax=Labrenzia sp. THAF35 TaxID=2587854 RepID=UPI0012A88AE5|nr:hypothetical protein [Labrenzia sp. THAF35]QFT69640.1 hypothetical protein FIU93_22845 [Labrenzia sp. THAF35]